MKSGKHILSWFFVLLLFCWSMNAQQTSSLTGSATVPRLVNFSGKATDIQGKTISGIAGATFAIYKEESGGSPLWLETQNVQADAKGNYTAQLGATKTDGLPLDLFSSGEARWLGVTVNGGQEQPRVLLLSVPYALKAADAETIGGLPASAFVLAGKGQGSAPSTKTAPASTPSTSKNAAPPANPAVTGKGVVNFIPMWDTTSDIVDSVMFQKSSQIGINTTIPAATLDVNGKSDVRDTLTLFPKGTDSTLAVNGTNFKVDQTGKVTFASGQTFPGAGTVSSVGLSAPTTDFTVTGSPVTKSGTLKFAWTIAPTSANIANAIVKRDSSGNFSATTITADAVSANGTVSGEYVTASALPGSSYAIFGQASPSIGVTGAGVFGIVTSGDPSLSYGVYGENDSASGGKGVFGYSPNGNEAYAVQGYASGTNAFGVVGTNNPFGLIAQGIRGTAPVGVIGDSASGYAVVAASDGGSALLAESGSTSDTLIAVNNGGGAPLYAQGTGGNYMFMDKNGNLFLTGQVFASAKDFKIDHPLDPANKYLYHASIESSEMKNIYDGVAVLDAGGAATVELPDWFEAVNGDFRYQLTAVGAPGPNLHIAQEIANNRFTIAGGQPGMKASWQVTGIRHDAYAKTHPFQTSVDKPADERGFYLHPELYGAAAEKSLAAHHAQFMHHANAK